MRIPLLSVIISAAMFGQTLGWGGDAHRIVAKIASKFIRDSTKKHIAELLEVPATSRAVDRAMIETSIWADSQEWSGELHFAHTPYQDCSQPFDFTTDCGFDGSGRCIVSALANYTVRVSDPRVHHAERAEALKFILHLVADIHNPLHLGFADDFGGNAIDVEFDHGFETLNQSSLHDVWDTALVEVKQNELLAELPKGVELEPWALSEDLLKSIPSNAEAAEYILDVTRADVGNLASATALMERMASGITQTYTCELAYKNDLGEYIEPNELLTPMYLESRSELTMDLLKRAGIRLAEVLNTVVGVYNARVRDEAAAAGVALARTTKRQSLAENPFYLLDIDFDAEALVYTGEPEPAEARPGSPESPVEVAVRHRTKAPKTTTPEPTTTTLSPEEVKRARRARENARKKLRKRLVQGVDIEKAVLIKRRGKYVVTSAELATEHYFPVQFEVFLVSFGGNADSTPMTFLFDAAFFGRQQYNAELIGKTLFKIRDLPYVAPAAPPTTPAPGEFTTEEDDVLESDDDEEAAEPPSLCFERVQRDTAEFEGALKLGESRLVSSNRPKEELEAIAERLFGWSKEPAAADAAAVRKAKRKAKYSRAKENTRLRKIYGYLPTRTELWDDQFKAELDNIAAFAHDHILLYVHKNTILNATSPMIKANLFKAYSVDVDLTVQYYMLVDHRIYDGELTDYVGDTLQTIGRRNSRLIKELDGKRKTLWKELRDVDEVYFGTDPKRLETLKVIRMLHSKPANVDESYFRIAWSIHGDDAERRVEL